MKRQVLLWMMALSGFLANAQGPTLIAPNAASDIYPTPGSNIIANSCYGVTTSFGGNIYDLYVSGWTRSGICCTGKIVWRFLPLSAVPPSVVMQGEIPINSGGNIDVVSAVISGTNFICAAYYKPTVGFVFERYRWNSFLSNFSLYTSQVLTASPHKIINMDTYLGNRITVVWDEVDPNAGGYVVKCMLVKDLASTQAITLTTSVDFAYPDVAMSKNSANSPTNGELEAHIVYHSLNAMSPEIDEVVVPFETLFLANPPSYTPVIEDVNNISGTTIHNFATIDCPDVCDFAPSASWAYTYCDNQGIKVRLSEPSTGTAPVTKNIVDGSDYGNFNLVPYGVFNESTISYDMTGQSIHVGGRIEGTPGYEGLFAVEISSDGTTLVSPMDYQLISLSPSSKYLQFSKDNLYSSYLYAVYSGNGNESTHLFHQWGDAAFKGQGTVGMENIAGNKELKMNFYPNPINKSNVHVNMSTGLQDKDIDVLLTTISGKVLFTGSINGRQFETSFQPVMRDLAAGTYILTTSNNNMNYFQTRKLVKAE